MTIAHVRAEHDVPHPSLDSIIARYGAWRVIRTALAAAISGKGHPQRLDPQRLPNTMRRDLGLPPLTDPPTHWEYWQ